MRFESKTRKMTTGVADYIGLTFPSKHAEAIPVNMSCAVMPQEGKMIGIVGVARDMR
jgi:hypothetical protein